MNKEQIEKRFDNIIEAYQHKFEYARLMAEDNYREQCRVQNDKFEYAKNHGTFKPKVIVPNNYHLTIFPKYEVSNWKCYLFGNKPGGPGMIYTPEEGQVPNCFVRYFMKIFLGCTWIKDN